MKGEVESPLDEEAKTKADKIAYLTTTSNSTHAILNRRKRSALKLVVNEVEEPARMEINRETIAKPKFVRMANDDHKKESASRGFWIWQGPCGSIFCALVKSC